MLVSFEAVLPAGFRLRLSSYGESATSSASTRSASTLASEPLASDHITASLSAKVAAALRRLLLSSERSTSSSRCTAPAAAGRLAPTTTPRRADAGGAARAPLLALPGVCCVLQRVDDGETAHQHAGVGMLLHVVLVLLHAQLGDALPQQQGGYELLRVAGAQLLAQLRDDGRHRGRNGPLLLQRAPECGVHVRSQLLELV